MSIKDFDSQLDYTNLCNPMINGANLWINDELVTDVEFPNGMQNIGNQLTGCVSVKSVVIPSSVLSIGSNAFSGCTGLTSVIIPESVIAIGNYAFRNCTSLSDIKLGENIVQIGDFAFYGCSSLQSITLPKNIISISYDAFLHCEQLEIVYSKNIIPPKLAESALNKCPINRIYVPTGYVEAYKAADGWKQYADKIEGYNFTE